MPLQGAALGCCNESGARVRFGVGMLVPLQGAAAGCRCRVPLQGAAAGAAVVGFFSEAAGDIARGQWLRRKDLCSQNTSSALANDQRSELGSLRYDSSMIRGMIRKPILF